MPRLDLLEAQRLKKVVVDPLLAALRAEMRQNLGPLVEEMSALRHHEARQDQRLEQIEQRLGAVERFKLRIVTVCSAIAVVTGIVWRTVLDWIRQHFPKDH
ncbi:MAG: hypothetical protein ABR964_00530 [Tepidisphaeraceae bacterium]